MAVLPAKYCAIIPTKETLGHGSRRFDPLATHFLLVDLMEVKIAAALNPPALVDPIWLQR